MIVGYARVSTLDQNELSQETTLKELGCERIFTDKSSGRNLERPNFNTMIDFLREGDVLYVTEFSRLSRNSMELLKVVDTLNKKGVIVKSKRENFDTTTPQGKMMLGTFALLAEYEMELMLQRQREGIALAKSEGKYKGRGVKKHDKKLLEMCMSSLEKKELTVTQVAKLLKVTRATVYSIVNNKEKYISASKDISIE